MQNNNEEGSFKQQLTEELQLVKYRMRMLDIMEQKLLEMRELTTYVRDNILNSEGINVINIRIKELYSQVKCIDEESRVIT